MQSPKPYAVVKMKINQIPVMAILLLASACAGLPIIATHDQAPARAQGQTEPLLKKSLSPAKPSTLRILFGADSAELPPGTAESIGQYNGLTQYRFPDMNYVIEAWTDAREAEGLEFNLGCQRARAVRDEFVGIGFPAERMLLFSYGVHAIYGAGGDEEARAQTQLVDVMPMQIDDWEKYKRILMLEEPGEMPRCRP